MAQYGQYATAATCGTRAAARAAVREARIFGRATGAFAGGLTAAARLEVGRALGRFRAGWLTAARRWGAALIGSASNIRIAEGVARVGVVVVAGAFARGAARMDPGGARTAAAAFATITAASRASTGLSSRRVGWGAGVVGGTGGKRCAAVGGAKPRAGSGPRGSCHGSRPTPSPGRAITPIGLAPLFRGPMTGVPAVRPIGFAGLTGSSTTGSSTALAAGASAEAGSRVGVISLRSPSTETTSETPMTMIGGRAPPGQGAGPTMIGAAAAAGSASGALVPLFLPGDASSDGNRSPSRAAVRIWASSQAFSSIFSFVLRNPRIFGMLLSRRAPGRATVRSIFLNRQITPNPPVLVQTLSIVVRIGTAPRGRRVP